MKKDEFIKLIQDCQVPERFDQRLLDEAAAMMKKWGEGLRHEGADKEYLFKNFGLTDKSDDSDAIKKEKAAIRCIASKIFKTEMRRDDAVGVMKNFNKIKEPGFKWLE